METIFSVFLALILLAIIRDGLRDGMLVTRHDWMEFAFFLVSLLCIGGGAWLLAKYFWPEQRTVGTIFLFVVAVLSVKIGLSGHNRRQQESQIRRNGTLTAQEFNQRIDAALARINSQR